MKQKDYDKKIFRLIAILYKLDANQNVSTKNLAGEFNVNVRTIQRDIELLGQAGFPLIQENGRYRFAPEYSLHKVPVNKFENNIRLYLKSDRVRG